MINTIWELISSDLMTLPMMEEKLKIAREAV
jgi:hypothetical protein